MFVEYLDAIAALGLAVLFLAGVFLLGVCLWIFARALAETQRYRSHRLSTDAQETTLQASEEAVDELAAHPSRRRDQVPPTDEEMRAFTRAQTLLGEEGEFVPPESYTTTEQNAAHAGEYNGEADIPPDRLYVRP